MSKLVRLLVLFLVLLGLTGCPTAPKQPAWITPLQHPSPLHIEPALTNSIVSATPTTNLVIPPPQERSVAPTNLVVPTRPVPPVVAMVRPLNQVSNQWLPWQSWVKTYGQPAPASSSRYEIRTTNGTLALKIGYKEATWNGTVLSLGFPAIITNGQAHIHNLDVAKSLLPLLGSSPQPHHPRPILVLDAGHGGDNPGATSVSGGYEKDYALDWARRVQKLLSARGWIVHLTRTNDFDLSLVERVARAEELDADLFLSLHFNSVEKGGGEHGIETYCLTPIGMPSTLAREFGDDVNRAYPNNAFDIENLQYAMRLHQNLVVSTGRRDRGVRRARFMAVIREQHRPAVLIEGGYLSNPQEARLIADPGYRQKLAEAVASALAIPDRLEAQRQ